MKKILLFLLLFCAISAIAEEYTLTSSTQGKDGNYLVDLTLSTKKVKANLNDIVMQCAVHGVMFRGFAGSGDATSQKPLISDPNIEQTKVEFFTAFNNEGAYKRYASIIPGSMSIVKNKKLKCQEVTAKVIIKKESLVKYLETNGIIQGFSNLW